MHSLAKNISNCFLKDTCNSPLKKYFLSTDRRLQRRLVGQVFYFLDNGTRFTYLNGYHPAVWFSLRKCQCMNTPSVKILGDVTHINRGCGVAFLAASTHQSTDRSLCNIMMFRTNKHSSLRYNCGYWWKFATDRTLLLWKLSMSSYPYHSPTLGVNVIPNQYCCLPTLSPDKDTATAPQDNVSTADVQWIQVGDAISVGAEDCKCGSLVFIRGFSVEYFPCVKKCFHIARCLREKSRLVTLV